MSQRSILVTGATGFVGAGIIERLLAEASIQVYAGVRDLSSVLRAGGIPFVLGDLTVGAGIPSLDGISTVIHCAARVHVMKDLDDDALTEYRKVNVEGTLHLARRAAAAGVQRFIFLSSIKVNGESTDNRPPYSAGDQPSPADPYGLSKAEAEQALRALATETGMEVTIIRPVLVYGPGVKANFLSMMYWLNKGIPLPLGGLKNKRSMVALDNLVDLVHRCLDHPAAANQTFLVSDDEDLSTTDLICRTANALGRRARLFPLPTSLLILSARLLGRRAAATRLCGSLVVDITKTRTLLNWNPPLSVNRAIRKTALHFMEQQKI